MRLSCKALVFIALLLTSFAAKADTLNFTLSSSPDTFTFSLPSDPIPDSSSSGASFTLDGVMITEGLISFTTDLSFYNESDSSHPGGLQFDLPAPPIGPTGSIDLTGPQVYTGSESSPLFSTESLTLTDATGAAYTLDIASTVPEPSTLALFTTGMIALVGIARRKSSTHE
jgi:hypothetical protein